MILADTDVLIDYLAGVQPVAEQVAAYAKADRLQTSAITCFELLSGARDGKPGDGIRRLVSALPTLSLDRSAATQAAAVRQQCARGGFSIGMADSLIAGIALEHGLPLLTRNRKHFEHVEGLRLLPLDQVVD
ncbi:MAG: type II toxin-antitoxin system VapC family toxin [Acidobacteriia bacterium]|nr:type II toxin-antitoxin system VapC family toxin [Terriglobia bacterium]